MRKVNLSTDSELPYNYRRLGSSHPVIQKKRSPDFRSRNEIELSRNATRSPDSHGDNCQISFHQTTASFRAPHLRTSIWQAINSIGAFLVMWYLMYVSTALSYWLTLLLALPTAGFLVRIFAIQHDCGHRSFFGGQRANDLLGQACSVLTLTPYQLWRRTHARHHASSGDLGHRGQGDIAVLTVDEYLARSKFGRLRYRLYRNPFIMFVIGSSYLFILRQRFTFGIPRNWRRERWSVHATNLMILTAVAIACLLVGVTKFALIHGPVVVLGASIGSWLFFVQHQFEHAYWQPTNSWDFQRSALEGSSYYRLPPILQWFTGNIGFHHIHHLDSRIPNYNLAACHASNVAFQKVETLGIRESLSCVNLKLWDTDRQRMIRFADIDSSTIAEDLACTLPAATP